MSGYSFKRIVSFVALIAVLTVALVAGAVWKLRLDALALAGRNVEGMAGMLAEQVQQSTQAVDIAINEVEGALAPESPDQFRQSAASPTVGKALAAAADKRSSIDHISIDGADGAILATSRGAPPAGGKIDAQFERLKYDRSRATLIGSLHVSEATGEMVVDLLKRVEAPDGRFLGAIRVGVKPASLVTTYSPISAMPGRSYALFARDGRVLVRYPGSASIHEGEMLPRTSRFYGVVARGGGLYRANSVFDGDERLIAARPLPFSDLVVSVSVLTSTALAHWREQTIAVFLAGAFAMLMAAILTRALFVQFRKLAAKEAALLAQSSALELSNERFTKALGNMSQGLVVFDRDARVVISNARYATIYGLAPDAIKPGMAAMDILKLRAARGLYAGHTPESYIRDALRRRFTDQRIDLLADGRSILVNHAACGDGGLLVTHEDVTEREEANHRIAHMAMHDELTQVANRALFLQKLDALKLEIGLSHTAVVVMLFDLDDFKPVNDTHGHAAGDELLRQCARRILAIATGAHVVARLGGDEFALAYGVAEFEHDEPLATARGLIDGIRAPYSIDGHAVEVDACAGIAVIADAGLSIDDMMRRADRALYAAKGAGSGLARLFEPQMELEALTRHELAADLARAIEVGGLQLAYQPIVDADTLAIRQMEALLRWNHPRRGPIAPLDFIKLAEEMHLIERLGQWVIERACADAALWPDEIGVAVNVSPLQLVSGEFASVALAALERTGLAPRRLELEITESVLLQDKGGSLAALRSLRERGVSIALDDFGTGFSSMSYLKRFCFDKLKIDRCFVADSPRDAGSAAIVAATVQLARAFGIEVTAEGVETYEQYRTLRAAGVKLMQGYLFGRPHAIAEGLPEISAAVSITSGHRVA